MYQSCDGESLRGINLSSWLARGMGTPCPSANELCPPLGIMYVLLEFAQGYRPV